MLNKLSALRLNTRADGTGKKIIFPTMLKDFGVKETGSKGVGELVGKLHGLGALQELHGNITFGNYEDLIDKNRDLYTKLVDISNRRGEKVPKFLQIFRNRNNITDAELKTLREDLGKYIEEQKAGMSGVNGYTVKSTYGGNINSGKTVYTYGETSPFNIDKRQSSTDIVLDPTGEDSRFAHIYDIITGTQKHRMTTKTNTKAMRNVLKNIEELHNNAMLSGNKQAMDRYSEAINTLQERIDHNLNINKLRDAHGNDVVVPTDYIGNFKNLEDKTGRGWIETAFAHVGPKRSPVVSDRFMNPNKTLLSRYTPNGEKKYSYNSDDVMDWAKAISDTSRIQGNGYSSNATRMKDVRNPQSFTSNVFVKDNVNPNYINGITIKDERINARDPVTGYFLRDPATGKNLEVSTGNLVPKFSIRSPKLLVKKELEANNYFGNSIGDMLNGNDEMERAYRSGIIEGNKRKNKSIDNVKNVINEKLNKNKKSVDTSLVPDHALNFNLHDVPLYYKNPVPSIAYGYFTFPSYASRTKRIINAVRTMSADKMLPSIQEGNFLKSDEALFLEELAKEDPEVAKLLNSVDPRLSNDNIVKQSSINYNNFLNKIASITRTQKIDFSLNKLASIQYNNFLKALKIR